MSIHRVYWLVAGAALLANFGGCSDDAEPQGAGGGTTTAVSSSTASSSVVVASSSSSSGGMKTKLGSACSADADCGDDLRCITPSSTSPVLGGGAVNGYCTKDCLTESDCPGFGSVCLTPDGGGNGECYLGCAIGPELSFIDDMLDSNKCHGREDVRCTRTNAGEYCLPTCGDDSQCPGRCAIKAMAFAPTCRVQAPRKTAPCAMTWLPTTTVALDFARRSATIRPRFAPARVCSQVS